MTLDMLCPIIIVGLVVFYLEHKILPFSEGN
jgi:hypothetical protein